MITIEFEKCMYDKFIEKEELTTQELLSIGFTSKDLTRLKERGKLISVRRGVYALTDTDGLFEYSRELADKEDYNRSNLALDRCLEIEPNNGTLAARIFGYSLVDRDFDRVCQCMSIMEQADNKFYEHDQNFWLLLLSYVTDLPEVYKERVRGLTYEDICVLDDDSRYSDVELANKIRKMALNHEFSEAAKLVRETKEFEDSKLYASATFRLLNFANSSYYSRRALYVDLIGDENYSQLLNLLTEDREKWMFTPEEEYTFALVSQLVWMRENQTLPKVKGFSSINFAEAMKKRNYRLAQELYFYNFRANNEDRDETLKRDKILELMLKKINDEIEDMKVTQAAKRVGADEFSKVTAYLMNQDLDNAFKCLDEYLVKLNRCEYRDYVVSLIKLSLLDKDMAFTDPMLALSRLSRDDYKFDVAVYIQDFYFSLTNGNLKKAAIYLDIVSGSSDVGGIPIDTTDMRNTLVAEMNRLGMKEEALAVSMPKPKTTVTVEAKTVAKENASRDELASQYCQLSDVIAGVLEDDNVAMLEPMNDDDTQRVMELVGHISDIKPFIVDSTDGKSKHVVLKYCGRVGEYINIAEVLQKANTAYKYKVWEDCISLYEKVLPLLREPKGYIYSQLGMAYYRTTTDTNFSDAIDYLTLADAQAKKDGKSKISYADLVENLKLRSGYNGVRVNLDNGETGISKKAGTQYIKKDRQG